MKSFIRAFAVLAALACNALAADALTRFDDPIIIMTPPPAVVSVEVLADDPIVIMTPPPALCFDDPIVIMTPPPARVSDDPIIIISPPPAKQARQ